MTRFARAQGSKACNQKVPGEATKWEEMKVKGSSPKNKQEDAKSLDIKSGLKVRQKSSSKRKTNVWAIIDCKDDFKEDGESGNKKNLTAVSDSIEFGTNNDAFQENVWEERSFEEENSSSEEVTVGEECIGDLSVKKSESNLGNARVPSEESENDDDDDDDESPTEVGSKIQVPEITLPSPSQKRLKRKNFSIPPVPHKIQLKSGKDPLTGSQKEEPEKPFRNETVPKKVRIMGVRVKKEEFDDLMKVKKEMEEKGASKADVAKAMRMVARRKEKKIKRDNNKVCFICRVAGHLASACPSNAGPGSAGLGLCFKCGSTEHGALRCPSSRTDFPLATCFKCRKAGHLARNCPDNPNGLYPNGGACRGCGSVAHLRRDCPEVQKKKAGEKGARAALWQAGKRAVDALDEEPASTEETVSRPPPKKVVRM